MFNDLRRRRARLARLASITYQGGLLVASLTYKAALPAAPRPQPTPEPRRGLLPDRRRVGTWLRKSLALLYLAGLLVAVLTYKAAFVPTMLKDPFFGIYSICVCGYILSRFGLSIFYRAGRDAGLEPTIAIVMPAFNEQDAIAASLRALLSLEYPIDKLEIVAVNDGSSDETLREIQALAAQTGERLRVIDFPENRGKRAAMAAGIRATTAEVVVFVDSDSVVEANALRVLVQPFADPLTGAVCGHADVLNAWDSWLTRMQAVRYFVAFRVVKAAEAVFCAVTCCSGCFSAYRRSAILPSLDWWENQTFLGVGSTFGDDRSLTNCVLRDWRVRYERRAISHTLVPATLPAFIKQQTRWKRSWTRESLIVSRFIWRKHPVAAALTYMGIVLPLVAPVAAVHSLLLGPVAHHASPLAYLGGVYALGLVYSLYYVVCQERYNTLWVYGLLFVFVYLLLMLWQTYYAILTCRSTSWGTRAATAGAGEASG